MNIRKLIIFPLLFLAGLALASGDFLQEKPKKKSRRERKLERRMEEYRRLQSMKVEGTKNQKAATTPFNPEADPFAQTHYSWADSVFSTLSPRERIGQLFMVAAYSNRDEKHFREIDSLVLNNGIGGLIFMQGGPVRQANLTNRWQTKSKVPLMLSMDAEWGLAMRLDSVTRFPKQMTLGALPADSLVYEVGKEIALSCKRIGMQVNFGPVADVNNNPVNPVINMRSFGERKELVSSRAIAYMRGMQDQQVLATGKHFPGHGDTDADSHLDLPVVHGSRQRLDSLELYPFRQLFKAGLGSVMVAHLYIPSLDTTTNLASTLSPRVVQNLLKEELKFKGLVFTDALNMKGVAKFYTPGWVDVKALLAGNDMLLFSEDVPRAISLIDSAITTGEITQDQIDERVKKILKTKEWTGLNHLTPVNTANLVADLNTSAADKLNRVIRREALTLVQNNKNILPLKNTGKIALVDVGNDAPNAFQQTLSNYFPAVFFNAGKSPSARDQKILLDTLKNFETVIVSISNTNILARKNFGFTDEGVQLVNAIGETSNAVLVGFINPYGLNRIASLSQFDGIVVAYQDDEDTQVEAAGILAGTYPATGKLPVSINHEFASGTGLSFETRSVTPYAHPNEMGFDATRFAKVDSIILSGLKKEAYPGCQVLVARKGKIVYQKNFGYHTYKNKENPAPVTVKDNSVYDLASLTKILSTTLAAMKLADDGKLDINKPLGYYLPFIPLGHPHRNVLVKDALLHQAGFPAWIPFYKSFIANDTLHGQYFSSAATPEFSWQVAQNLYTRPAIKDSIFNQIWEAPFNPAQGYKYSDIGFIYMREVIEKITAQPIHQFVANTFYHPMGLTTLGYQPSGRIEKDRIVPTEYDTEFRKQLVQGHVHDQGAALLNGVSGHAGLFGNSFDVAAIMQMLLNGGEYNGVRYLDEDVVKQFTRTQDSRVPLKNRRGLGFDKPVREGSGPTFQGISPESYGHSGFTGTFTWADPEKEIVYVFLSNRVYPTSDNNKLLKMGIRSDVHEAIYQAISGK